MSFNYEQITKPESLLDFFYSDKIHKYISEPFWVFLQTEMTYFPTLTYT